MANIYRTTNVTDSGSLNTAIQQTALAKALGRLNFNLIVTALIENRTEDARDQGSRFGATVLIPHTGTTVITNKTPGTPAVPQAATATQQSITINKHKTWDILVEDYGSLFTGPQLILRYGLDAAALLAEAIETDVIANGVNGLRQIGGWGQSASWTTVTALRQQTRKDRWTQTMEDHIVLGPNAENALFGQDQFNKTYVYGPNGDDTVVTGDLGTRLGMHFHVSNLMPAFPGSPSYEMSLAFQQDGAGICFVDLSDSDFPEELRAPTVKIETMDYEDDDGNTIYSMRSILGYSQLDRGMLLTYDTIYGTGIVRPEKMYALFG